MAKSNKTLDPNTANALCYILGWISGIVMLILEKNDEKIRFHALQSIITFGSLTLFSLVTSVLPFIGLPISSLANIAVVILWLVLLLNAFQGEDIRLPYVSQYADEWVKKTGGKV